MRNKSLRASIQMLITVSILLLCVLGTTACNATPVTTPGSPLTTTAVTPTSSASAGQLSCGSISQLGPGSVPTTKTSTPQQIGDCFWQAYQQCTAASLTFVTSSIDTILTRTFQIQKIGGGCQVLDKVQMRIVPQPPRVKQTYTCTSVQKTTSTLQVLNCQDDGTITISLVK